MWRINSFFIGIKNLIYYFPVIWKDRDWDYAYMEYILLAKLKKWYKRYSSGDVKYAHANIKKELQAMRICINILERRINDFYFDVHDFGDKPEGYLEYIVSIEERDIKVFGKLYSQWINRWWD